MSTYIYKACSSAWLFTISFIVRVMLIQQLKSTTSIRQYIPTPTPHLPHSPGGKGWWGEGGWAKMQNGKICNHGWKKYAHGAYARHWLAKSNQERLFKKGGSFFNSLIKTAHSRTHTHTQHTVYSLCSHIFVMAASDDVALPRLICTFIHTQAHTHKTC